jgi:hypothetical protein
MHMSKVAQAVAHRAYATSSMHFPTAHAKPPTYPKAINCGQRQVQGTQDPLDSPGIRRMPQFTGNCSAVQPYMHHWLPVIQNQLNKAHRQGTTTAQAVGQNRHSSAHLINFARGPSCMTSCHLPMPSLGRAATKALRSRDWLADLTEL